MANGHCLLKDKSKIGWETAGDTCSQLSVLIIERDIEQTLKKNAFCCT